MISVIMPSLNVGEYIEKCIKSVCEQTYKDLEIICVDAGSTDGTLDIINSYAKRDPRIRIIHSDYKSYGHQMNLGIDGACGDYIGIVETDDYIALDMYKKLYECTKGGEVDFVKSGYFYLAGREDDELIEKCNGRSVDSLHLKMIDLDTNPEYRLADVNHIWTGLYSRRFINDNGIRFNETPGASFQDTSFSILVGLMAKKCVFTSEAYYHYRIDRLDSSVKIDSKTNCIIDEYKYVEDFCEKNGIFNKQILNYVNQIRVNTFFWNASRLNRESCTDFLNNVSNMLQELRNDYGFYEGLNDSEKEKIELMLNQKADIISQMSRAIRNKDVIEAVNWSLNHAGVICVGAGALMRRLLDIQTITGENFIKEIADNNTQLHNTSIGDYTIVSVEKAAQKYSNDMWLVVSSRYGEDILRQLIDLGINSSQIRLLKKVPNWMGYCLE